MTPSTLKALSPNYLVLSDVHLGADLVQHWRPWTAGRLERVPRVDHELGAMLDYYRQRADLDRPWRLVIAGDFIDLMGMSITASAHGCVPRTEDERKHGLGSTEDHVCAKIRAVVQRHATLFHKLAHFVDAGHSLVLIRGNHDVELYWEAAQRTFLDALLERSQLQVADPRVRADFEARVAFQHWFYYEPGLLYCEHGHQYDPNCSYHHLLAPISPSDPDRISYSFADILLRYVVHPTAELSPEGHDKNTLGTYLTLIVHMGFGGSVRLGLRFVGALARAVRTWREHLSEGAAYVRAEHERGMQRLAEVFGLDAERLSELAELWAEPVTAHFRTIFRTVFLDGLALGVCAAVVVGLLGVSGVVSWVGLAAGFALVSLLMYLYVKHSKVQSPHAALHARAQKLALLMPARYVVMGHSHRPFMQGLTDRSTYVNLGHWAHADEHTSRAPCSHLVIQHDALGRASAVLYGWDRRLGASVLRSDAVHDPIEDPTPLTDGELMPETGQPANLS